MFHLPIFRLLTCATLVLLGPGAGRGQEVLSTTAAVRHLSSEEAARQKPVKATGVLTWLESEADNDPRIRDEFGGNSAVIHDATGGIYVLLAGMKLAPEVAVGQQVEVEGFTAPGGYAPIIEARQIRWLGPGTLPPGIPATFEELQTGVYDCQRVEVRGVVQTAGRTQTSGNWYMRVALLGGRIGLNYRAAPDFKPAAVNNAEVRLRGVCFPFFNARRELLGVRLVVPFPDDLEILKPAPKWDEIPVTPLDRLLPFAPGGNSLHRRRVQGVVTYARPRDYFCLQEGARALRVQTRQAGALAIGDRVEANGFVNRENFFAELVESSFAPLGRAEPPAPVAVRPAEVQAGDFDARLVRLTAELRRTTTVGPEQRFYLEADHQLFEATLDPPDAAAAQWREGSVLQASGILTVLYRGRPDRPQFPDFAGFRLQLRGPTDLVLVRPAPWWTKERLLSAVAGLSLVLLAAAAWVHLLRQRVERRTMQLGREIRARHHSQLEYEATMRERSRLAGDLHDTVEQAFTAVSFQFQTARALRDLDAPRAEQHLELAEEFLSRSRDELRRSVWDLRTQVLEGRSLPDALRRHAAQLTSERELCCEIIVEGEKPLPELIAGHLFLFAQEALNNTLKHAGATRATLRLTWARDEVCLAVEDDGCGFDPAHVPGPTAGHFGLTGLRERVQRLGGTLAIESQPGRSTCLRATIPLETATAAR